jgi:hypothetical protein
MTNTEYVEHFKVLVGVVKMYGGAYGHELGLVAMQLIAQGVSPQDVDTADQEEIVKAEVVCHECYLSCMLLCGADNGRYSQLKVDLSNDMMKGTDNFPKMIVKTMHLLTNYVAPPRLQHACNPDGKGLAFVQGEGSAPCGPKRDSTNKGKINCGHCGGPHYKNECPKLRELDAGVQSFNINDCDEEHNLFLANNGYGLVQKQAKGVQGILSPYHAYINTCASYASTPYPELLLNLKKELRGLIGHSTAGLCRMDLSGLLGALEQVWLNEGGVATIIPLKRSRSFAP